MFNSARRTKEQIGPCAYRPLEISPVRVHMYAKGGNKDKVCTAGDGLGLLFVFFQREGPERRRDGDGD